MPPIGLNRSTVTPSSIKIDAGLEAFASPYIGSTRPRSRTRVGWFLAAHLPQQRIPPSVKPTRQERPNPSLAEQGARSPIKRPRARVRTDPLNRSPIRTHARIYSRTQTHARRPRSAQGRVRVSDRERGRQDPNQRNDAPRSHAAGARAARGVRAHTPTHTCVNVWMWVWGKGTPCLPAESIDRSIPVALSH